MSSSQQVGNRGAAGAAAGTSMTSSASSGSLPSPTSPRSREESSSSSGVKTVVPNHAGVVVTPRTKSEISVLDKAVQCTLYHMDMVSEEVEETARSTTTGTRDQLRQDLALWKEGQRGGSAEGMHAAPGGMDNLAFWICAAEDHLATDLCNDTNTNMNASSGFVRLADGPRQNPHDQDGHHLVPDSFSSQPFHCPACSNHLLDPGRDAMDKGDGVDEDHNPMAPQYPTNVNFATTTEDYCHQRQATSRSDGSGGSNLSSARGSGGAASAVAGLPPSVLEELLYGNGDDFSFTPRPTAGGGVSTMSTGTMTPRHPLGPFSLGSTPRPMNMGTGVTPRPGGGFTHAGGGGSVLATPRVVQPFTSHEGSVRRSRGTTPLRNQQPSPIDETGTTPVSADSAGGGVFPGQQQFQASPPAVRRPPSVPKLAVVRLKSSGGSDYFNTTPSSYNYHHQQQQPLSSRRAGPSGVTPMRSVGSASSLTSWSVVGSPGRLNCTGGFGGASSCGGGSATARSGGGSRRGGPTPDTPTSSGGAGSGSGSQMPASHSTQGSFYVVDSPVQDQRATPPHGTPPLAPPTNASTCTYASSPSGTMTMMSNHNSWATRTTTGDGGGSRQSSASLGVPALTTTSFVYCPYPQVGAGLSFTPRSIASSAAPTPRDGASAGDYYTSTSLDNPLSARTTTVRTTRRTASGSSGGGAWSNRMASSSSHMPSGSSREDLVNTPRVTFSDLFGNHRPGFLAVVEGGGEDDEGLAASGYLYIHPRSTKALRQNQANIASGAGNNETTEGSASGSPVSVATTEPMNSLPASPVQDDVMNPTSSPVPTQHEAKINNDASSSRSRPGSIPNLIPAPFFAAALLVDGVNAAYGAFLRRPLSRGKLSSSGHPRSPSQNSQPLRISSHLCRFEEMVFTWLIK